MSSKISKGIWSNFTKRSPSLAIKNNLLRSSLLSSNPRLKPASLRSRKGKVQYSAPTGLSDIYPLAYNLLQEESQHIYQQIEVIDQEIQKDESTHDLVEELKQLREELLIAAEKSNPEVVYMAKFQPSLLDRSVPVHREYLKEKWESYAKMLTMQRIESLGVIPDSLPTLDPKVDVRLKFPNTAVDTWVEPGVILPSNASSKPPIVEITEFTEVKDEKYTVLMIDLDIPDVVNNAYSTTLLWGVKDVTLSNLDYTIDSKKLDSNPEYEFVEYLPPTPEKNTGKHRIAIWVLKQEQNAKLSNAPQGLERENFNIRQFVDENALVPVGAHVFRSIWDRSTEHVREMYGLPKGRIFARERY